MSDDFDNALDAKASTAPAESGDPFGDALTARASATPSEVSASVPQNPTGQGMTPIDKMLDYEAKSLYAQGAAGVHTIHDWLSGKLHSISEAHKQNEAEIAKNAPAPLEKGSTAETLDRAFQSPANPLNWPSWALKEGGKLIQKGLEMPSGAGHIQTLGGRGALQQGIPSQYTTIAGAGAEAVANVALGTYGAAKALGIGKTPVAEPAPRVEPTIEPPEPVVTSEPARGGLGLNETQRGQRAEVLSRVGIENARESALSGDKGNAATDYQLTKFNQEPAGQAAAAQFEHEKQALTQHAESIVKDTGGSVGMDQDSLLSRGKTIAQPFDDLRDWFDKQHEADYKAAKERLGNAPIGQMDNVQGLLNDRTLKNTLAADNKTPLLGAVQNQLDFFRENNPAGLTADTAEQFRQFMNSMWDAKDPAKNRFISRVKEAIDADVTKAAGEDVYGAARKRVALEHTLLDDPKGISKAFDYEPRTPMNRATPFEKIPDFVTRLDADQLSHIVQTLKNMPEEIQPQAKQALSEIRAHYANKILEAGSSTQGQWNAPKVSQVLKQNAAKLKIAFADAPELMPKIEDLDSAGRILKTDQSYPGAAAQASSALKRGMMSHVLTKAGSTAGAVVGGATGSVFGPGGAAVGAGAGAAAGEALGAKAARSSAEKAALRNWENRTVRLSDFVKGRSGPPPP